jgi:hypothetical protein
MVHNMIHLSGEKVLTPRPTPNQEDHPLSAVRDCLFNIFAATLHIGGRSTIRNTRTRHSVVTGTHLSWVDVFGDEKTSARRNLCSVPSSPYPSPYTDATPALYIKELGNTDAPSAGCKNICLTTRSNKTPWNLASLVSEIVTLFCRKVLTSCFVPHAELDLRLHVQFHHLHDKNMNSSNS